MKNSIVLEKPVSAPQRNGASPKSVTAGHGATSQQRRSPGRPDDPPGGNRFAGAFFAGPAGTDDPSERIAAIRGAVLSVREEPAIDVLGMLSPVLSRVPSGLLGLALGSAAPRVDLSGSNVPGLTADAYAAGARVDRMFVFGPLPGASMLAILVSYVGTCCIGINCDGAVFENTPVLWSCMQVLRVVLDDDDGVIGFGDDPDVRTAPLGVVGGAVAGVLTGLSPR